MSIGSSLAIAVKALGRHRLQTALTMLGMTIGVAAVLTMIALGRGAEAAIEQQVRAAGMNLVVVTAGNYKLKTEDDFGGVVDHQARLGAREPRATSDELRVVPVLFHPENDPMEKHDHPTASQRLGDLEAGLGAAATLTSDDADAIRRLGGVQYVAEGVHQNAHVVNGAKRWFTRLNGTDVQLPLIRRTAIFLRPRVDQFRGGSLNRLGARRIGVHLGLRDSRDLMALAVGPRNPPHAELPRKAGLDVSRRHCGHLR